MSEPTIPLDVPLCLAVSPYGCCCVLERGHEGDHDPKCSWKHKFPPEPPKQECSSCDGKGTEADYVGLEMRCIEVECPMCKGTGKVPSKKDGTNSQAS